MKKKYFILSVTFISLLIFGSCKNNSSTAVDEFDEVQKITSDFKTWWIYHNENIDFESEFVAYDYGANEISKLEFLKKLFSENVIPFKTDSTNNTSTYTLFKIDTTNSSEKNAIVKASRQESLQTYYYLSLEGKPFPNFNFVDLDNQIHTNESIKNKTIILKTWFIACKPCIAEFPELNRIVNKYKNNEDILFISLATDSRESLNEFLLRKPFNYKVIPEQRHFITEILKLQAFPTHLIVDKNGIIQKVGSIKQVYRFLEENHSSSKSTNNPPPPSI